MPESKAPPIRSHAPNDAYRKGWEETFRKPEPRDEELEDHEDRREEFERRAQ